MSYCVFFGVARYWCMTDINAADYGNQITD